MKPNLGPHTRITYCANGCGRMVSNALGCHFCSTLLRYWHRAQDEHVDWSREQCILVGSLVAGMEEAFVREHGRGRVPTKTEYDQAVDCAAAMFKGFGYLLRPDKKDVVE